MRIDLRGQIRERASLHANGVQGAGRANNGSTSPFGIGVYHRDGGIVA